MPSKIERFFIKSLHGYKDINLRFKDNILIIVGENGSGKTTVLRLLFYLLSGQWTYLVQYNFERLSVWINGAEYQLSHEQLAKSFGKLNTQFLTHLPTSAREQFFELLEHGGEFAIADVEELCQRHGIPVQYVLNELTAQDASKGRSKELADVFEKISKSLDSQILYLPTYRRIEQELSSIFRGIDEDEWRRTRRPPPPYARLRRQRRVADTFVELIEFGMKDVELAINNGLQQLKDFHRESLNALTLGYLGDVVDQEYSQVQIRQIQKPSEETIKSVIDRIPEGILSKERKEHLSQTIGAVRARRGGTLEDHDKVVCHYFLKLLHHQEELRQKEAQMTAFCDVCNQYMKGKRFLYDSSSFTFGITAGLSKDRHQPIELRQLSSGEKQIVSLFSHLYLSGRNTYFLLIDEPELSLSVPWQRRFLMDVRKGGFCSGIVAATHSPFIYENDLHKYARGLGEFEE